HALLRLNRRLPNGIDKHLTWPGPDRAAVLVRPGGLIAVAAAAGHRRHCPGRRRPSGLPGRGWRRRGGAPRLYAAFVPARGADRSRAGRWRRPPAAGPGGCRVPSRCTCGWSGGGPPRTARGRPRTASWRGSPPCPGPRRRRGP
ncbi:hypothetical protein HBB16_16730, partial [Pseudonocardia sp. MCCB 268]|nr:hypothetical protein [Pseudonocardia cytotoxica]